MVRTADRFPGEREDEGMVLSDEGVGTTQVGEIRYNAGAFQMQDALGAFNPRNSGSSYTATRRGQILFSLDASTFVPANPVVDDVGDIVTDDTYEMVVET